MLQLFTLPYFGPKTSFFLGSVLEQKSLKSKVFSQFTESSWNPVFFTFSKTSPNLFPTRCFRILNRKILKNCIFLFLPSENMHPQKMNIFIFLGNTDFPRKFSWIYWNYTKNTFCIKVVFTSKNKVFAKQLMKMYDWSNFQQNSW